MGTGWGTVAEHPAIAALGELDTSLDTLTAANLWSLSTGELRDLRVEIERVTARLAAASLAVTRQIETTGAAVEVGAVSTAAWLRGTCRLDPRAAKRDVKLAAALDGPMTVTREALGAGAIGVEHATVIGHTLDHLPPTASDALRTDGQAWLVQQATVFDPQALGRLGRHLRHVADPDGHDRRMASLEAEEAQLHRDRAFTLTHRHDGARLPKGLLDPETGALLDTALDALSAPVPSADGTPDPRSPAQRRHDSLADLIRLALTNPAMPTDGGEPVTLVVTIPLSTLEHRLTHPNGSTVEEADVDQHRLHRGGPSAGESAAGELENGTPISAETARRLACDAALVAAVLGTHSEVLDLGRLTRTPTRPMRRALVTRDRGCAFPGCGRPPRWCHAHHIVHWANGGDTSLCNLVLLCGRHHRVIHHEGWTVRIGPHGQPLFRPPRWIDPHQTELPASNTTRRHALHHIPSRT